MKIEKLFSVAGKVAVVTGGSRGIGEMIARALIENGARVIITSRKNAEKKGYTKAVFPIGYGEKTSYQFSQNIVDVTDTGHMPAGAKAYKQAGLSAKDINSFHPYDDFIIAMLIQYSAGTLKRG
jgi:NAD(P)-dependent dehydrogenase (short-subunit alcohol dehydrogenase family)